MNEPGEERQRLENEKSALEAKLLSGGTIGVLFGHIQRIYEINDFLDALDSDERAAEDAESRYVSTKMPVPEERVLDVDIDYIIRKAKTLAKSLTDPVSKERLLFAIREATEECANRIQGAMERSQNGGK